MAGLPTDHVDKQGFILPIKASVSSLGASELEMKPTLDKSHRLESSYANQWPLVSQAALSSIQGPLVGAGRWPPTSDKANPPHFHGHQCVRSSCTIFSPRSFISSGSQTCCSPPFIPRQNGMAGAPPDHCGADGIRYHRRCRSERDGGRRRAP